MIRAGKLKKKNRTTTNFPPFLGILTSQDGLKRDMNYFLQEPINTLHAGDALIIFNYAGQVAVFCHM